MRPALAASFLLLAFACASSPAADERLAVPGAEDVKKAKDVIQDLFKDDYKKAKAKAAARIPLAEALFKQATESKNDPAGKYALLCEARENAARGGDPDLAGKVVEQLAAAFKLTPGEALLPIVDALTNTTGNVAQLQAAAEVLMSGAEEAETAEDWPTAATLYKAASAVAYKGKMQAWGNEARDNAKNIEQTKAEFEKIKPHLKTLAEKPDDPAANFAVGRFFCFFKGDWATGLGHLAKGSDEKLAQAAKADEAASKGSEEEQMAAAELWYTLAMTAEAVAKSPIRGRAHHWYSTAAAGLTGLTKTKATKRADELKADADSRSSDWKFWAELRRTSNDKQTKKLTLVGGAFTNVEFSDMPEGGGILIGLRYSTTKDGQFPRAVQPIYLTARGEVLGKGFGIPDKGTVPLFTKAKPGYAIGAWYSRGGGGLDAIQPIYMRIDGSGLNTKDKYDGPYIGGKGGGEATTGGTGTFIVGIHGKAGPDGHVGAVGLIALESPTKPKTKK